MKISNDQEPETQPVRKWRARLAALLTHQAGPAGWRQVHTTPLSLAWQGVVVTMMRDQGRLWVRLSLLVDGTPVARRAVPEVVAADPWRLAEVLDAMHAELRA